MSEFLNVSLKVLKNKAYKVLPVFKTKQEIRMYRPEDIVGIKLVYKNSGQAVWEKNRGVITLDQLAPESKEYVIDLFTDKSLLKIFGEIGD